MTIGVRPDQLGLEADAHQRLLRFFKLPPARRQALARHKFEPSHANVYRGYFPPQNEDPTYKEGLDAGADLAHPERIDLDGIDPLAPITRQWSRWTV